MTGVFQHQSSKFTRGLTGERNDLGAPNVTRVSLSHNTERIIIGALQVHSALQTIPHKGFLKRQEITHKLRYKLALSIGGRPAQAARAFFGPVPTGYF